MSGSQIQAINGASWIGSPRKVTPLSDSWPFLPGGWSKLFDDPRFWPVILQTNGNAFDVFHITPGWLFVYKYIYIYIYNKKHLPWGPVSSPEIRKASWCSSWKAIFGSHDHPSGPSKFLRHPCPGLRSTYGLPTVYLRSTYVYHENKIANKPTSINQLKSLISSVEHQNQIKFRWIWVKVTSNGMVHAENYQDLRSGFTFCPCWAIQIVTCHLSLPTAS